MQMKGILLAGGVGSRMHPITVGVSKQLLPVYDKPMIYYSLSVLMLAGIRDVLLISTPQDIGAYRKVLSQGSQWGLKIAYETQQTAGGIAQAFLIARDFIGKSDVCLVLGDNIFYGRGLSEQLRVAASNKGRATVFAYYVSDPGRYGVVTFDAQGRATSIEEKPVAPKSNYAVTGLYFYDNSVIEVSEGLKPSARGELEITDVNNVYLSRKQLDVIKLGRGIAWLDTGTHETLLQASMFIEAIESRQGLQVACPEEIALRQGYINAEQVRRAGETMPNSRYGAYLVSLAELAQQEGVE